jgi:hypothetical protein
MIRWNSLLPCIALGIAAVTLGAASPAHAALDEQLTAGASDVHVVHVADRDLLVREHAGVKELADASGKVVAAKWEGFTDLRGLLGAHYEAYTQALRSARFGLHFVHVKTDELEITIVSYGATRHGAIALTKAMPKGVTLDALR